MEGFNEYLRLFGSFLAWTEVFEIIPKRVRVGEIKGIVIEVRTKEQGHNVPHVHAEYEGKNISISLIDFRILAGNLRSVQEKTAVEWVKANIEKIKPIWNEYHKFTVPAI